ncbi:MAG: peptidoglycan DD-metalloendopeptidase family protein [Pseudomonadota bacterium]
MAAPLGRRPSGRLSIALVSLLVTALAACSYRAAPPEKRRPAPRYEPAAPGSTRIQRPSFYTVKRGDTLYAIAWRYGLDYRDLARWNRVQAPFVIHPQQPLRLYPPRVVPTPVRTTTTASTAAPPPKAQASTPRQAAATPPTSSSNTPASRPPAKPRPAAATPAKPKPAATSGAVAWRWPLEGNVLAEFSNAAPNLQGLDIAAAPGTAVQAAAAGEVVYSGNGLVGYGELIIIKHSDRYLSAYAHNRQRFVREGQAVSAGEKIAEVGSNGSQKSRLHFQIRENGKPVNPRKHLPKR